MITIKELKLSKIYKIFDIAKLYKIKDKENNLNYNINKILINAFFEPSTRTSLSFESAMYKLGGKVINFNKDISSLKKGESINDTLKTLENYGDIMVIRHPDKDLIYDVCKSNLLNIPIINGGNGADEHPTQALLDLFTIYEKFNYDYLKLNNLKILFVGDIINSRTIHSLIDLLKFFPDNKINLLPYSKIYNPDNNLLNNISITFKQDINNIIVNTNNIKWDEYDVIYCTRLQKERNTQNDDYFKNIVIDNDILNKLKKNCMIMHPLPRNDEINPEVDNDERVYYFKQMKNGVYIRMAIINLLLND